MNNSHALLPKQYPYLMNTTKGSNLKRVFLPRLAGLQECYDTQYLTRELASLRAAISEVTTKDHLHGELANAIEEIVSKLNKKS
jgi:hypothetical protein